MAYMTTRLMTCLVSLGKTQLFTVDFKRTLSANEPLLVRIREVDTPAYLGPFVRYAVGASPRDGAEWHTEYGVCERLLMG